MLLCQSLFTPKEGRKRFDPPMAVDGGTVYRPWGVVRVDLSRFMVRLSQSLRGLSTTPVVKNFCERMSLRVHLWWVRLELWKGFPVLTCKVDLWHSGDLTSGEGKRFDSVFCMFHLTVFRPVFVYKTYSYDKNFCVIYIWRVDLYQTFLESQNTKTLMSDPWTRERPRVLYSLEESLSLTKSRSRTVLFLSPPEG